MTTVFVLDLDGTIVGDVQDILNDYYMRTEYSNLLNKVTSRFKQHKKDVFAAFDNGLLRPYFIQFCKYITTDPQAVVYVYTASTQNWAAYLINVLESYIAQKIGTKFRFERPIFTRNHCHTNTMMKCLQVILPMIKKRQKHHFNLIMVDNNPTLERGESGYLLQCPSYDFSTPIDYMRSIDWSQFHKSIRINPAMNQYLPVPLNNSGKVSITKAISNYHLGMYNRYKYVNEKNKQYSHDTFWKSFLTAFKNVTINNDLNSLEGTLFTDSVRTEFQKVIRKSDSPTQK